MKPGISMIALEVTDLHCAHRFYEQAANEGMVQDVHYEHHNH